MTEEIKWEHGDGRTAWVGQSSFILSYLFGPIYYGHKRLWKLTAISFLWLFAYAVLFLSLKIATSDITIPLNQQPNFVDYLHIVMLFMPMLWARSTNAALMKKYDADRWFNVTALEASNRAHEKYLLERMDYEDRTRKYCPDCRSKLHVDVKVCRFCRFRFSTEGKTASPS